MTTSTDLDRLVVAWLREGDSQAPGHLAGRIQRAVAATKPVRRPWWLEWLLRQRGLRLQVAILAALLLITGLAIGLGGSALPPAPTPTPTSSPRPTISALPVPTTDLSGYLVSPPAATYPAARAMVVGDVEFQLPPGWSDPPGPEAMAIIAALDRLGDPYAGVLNMMGSGPYRPASAGHFAFHMQGDAGSIGRVDAGIYATVLDAHGSLGAEADATVAELEAGGNLITRRTASLAIGPAIQLDWDHIYRGPAIHYRSILFEVDGRIVRVDLGTVGAPSKSIVAAFESILDAAELVPNPSATPTP